MAIANMITILALLFGLFGPPVPADPGYTIWPENLDHLYTLIDTESGGWTFEGECPANQTLITWAQVKQIEAANLDGDQSRVVISTRALAEIGIELPAVGVLDISEQELFGMLIIAALQGAYSGGEMIVCRPPGDKVGLTGSAADVLIAGLAMFVTSSGRV